MSDSDMKAFKPNLAARIAAARAAVTWERLWRAMWPPLGVVAVFLALALTDALTMLPGWLHLLVLLGFAGGAGFLVRQALRTVEVADIPAGQRRLETSSGLEHRPLQVLEDDIAAGAGDPESRALWQAHRARMAEAAKRARVGIPAPGLARLDPYALRTVAGLLVVLGIFVAWEDPGSRMVRALSPDVTGAGAALPPKLQLWIKPPSYTGLAPVFPAALAPGAGEIMVPSGSVLEAQISGGRGGGELVLGKNRTKFEVLDPGHSRLTLPLAVSGRLAVRQRGNVLGSWQIRIVADGPPAIAFANPPTGMPNGVLRLPYTATDDYGLKEIKAEIRRTYENGTVTGKEVEIVDLPTPGHGVKSANETAFNDFAPHRWAGLPAVIRLQASDGAGNTGYSEEVRMVLPERQFNHPVARAVVAERKRLSTEPEKRRRIAGALMGIAANPGAYHHDTVVFLSLRSVASRLRLDPEETILSEVRQQLWETALRIEDGKLSLASRDLRQIQQDLMRALSENAPEAELERLMRELQRALNRFLREFALQRGPNANQDLPFDPSQRMLQSTDLQRMMEQIRDLMRSGARDAARQMLAELQNMLEALRNGRMMAGPSRNSPGARMMRQLQELTRRQRQLLDRTFRQREQTGPGARRQSRQGAMTQRQLQEMLKALRSMMGQQGQQGQQGQNGPAGALGRAGRFMEDAARALERNNPGGAVGPQGQALDQLQRAGRGLMQQMMNGMAGRMGMGRNGQFNPLQQRRDPLGRNVQGQNGMDTREVVVPDESTIRRVQQILQELRRRSGQSYRPKDELNYIERLLRRF